MIRRDKKGRFALPPKTPAYLAEQALLVRVRSVLSAFGADISEGTTNPRTGLGIVLRTYTPGLKAAIFAALAEVVPMGRELYVHEEGSHAGRRCYRVLVVPAPKDLAQGAPTAPAHGGPLASEVSA